MKELIDEMSLSADVERKEGDAVLVLRSSFIEDEPFRLSDPVQRAHMAGMAEYVSQLSCTRPPAWVEIEDYFLPEPVYIGSPRVHEILRTETPSAFRRRNLFCGRVAEKLIRLLA